MIVLVVLSFILKKKVEVMKKIILPDSTEAAEKRVLELWVSRTGRCYKEEELARYDGSTHNVCGCGNIIKKHYVRCSDCSEKKDIERYQKLEFKEWDGETPLCIHGDDTYFYSECDVDDYCTENELKPEELRLVICEPVKLPRLDVDFFEYCLPDDSDYDDLPDELVKVIDVFNKSVSEYKGVLSWVPGIFRTSVKL